MHKDKRDKYPKLKLRVKERWLKALRSGDFKQGQGKLKQQNDDLENEHCCLGVLLEAGLGAEASQYNVYAEAWVGASQTLINTIQLSQAFKSYNAKKLPENDVDDAQQALINMNDEKRWSFKKIANWIEKNL